MEGNQQFADNDKANGWRFFGNIWSEGAKAGRELKQSRRERKPWCRRGEEKERKEQKKREDAAGPEKARRWSVGTWGSGARRPTTCHKASERK